MSRYQRKMVRAAQRQAAAARAIAAQDAQVAAAQAHYYRTQAYIAASEAEARRLAGLAKTCAHCRHVNPPGSARCGRCGGGAFLPPPPPPGWGPPSPPPSSARSRGWRAFLVPEHQADVRRSPRRLTHRAGDCPGGCHRAVRRYAAVVLFFGLLVGLAVEIAVFVWVAQQIGLLLALVILVVTSGLGPFTVRRVGLGVLAKTQGRLQAGELPTRELLDGVLILVGGALICLPGFVSDAAGLLLMVGPVRHLVIRLGGHRVARRVTTVRLGRSRVIDARSRPAAADRPPSPGRPELPLGPDKDPPPPR